jgi:alpha-methylacyl-CoA racemase
MEPTTNDVTMDTPSPAAQHDRSTWPALRSYFTDAFASKTRDDWARTFSTGDSCVTPVLEISEVGPDGEGSLEVANEKSWNEEGGIPEPAPHLRRTPARRAADWYAAPDQTDPEAKKKGYFLTPGKHTRQIMQEVGYGEELIDKLLGEGAVTGI